MSTATTITTSERARQLAALAAASRQVRAVVRRIDALPTDQLRPSLVAELRNAVDKLGPAGAS